jgi:hypothetical protein
MVEFPVANWSYKHESPGTPAGPEWDTSGERQCAAGKGAGPLGLRVMSEADRVTSIRQAAAVCNVTPPVIRRWLSLGLLTGPPWTRQQLHQIRDETDPQGRRRGPQATHGTLTRWLEGCDCDRCRQAQNDAARARFRRKAQGRLPAEVRQQLLDAIYGGQPFHSVLGGVVWFLAGWPVSLLNGLMSCLRLSTAGFLML